MFEPKLWIKPTNTKWLVKEISQYLDWIIKKGIFDGEMNIFLTNAKFVYDSSARKREGNFFGPFDKSIIPSLYFPLGDIFRTISRRGKENAVCDWLQYLTLFLYDYVDWQEDREFNSELNNDLADKMIYEYIDFNKISFESEDRRKKEIENEQKIKVRRKKKEKTKQKNLKERLNKRE